jgi:katanin p60 ATPase-containing subunit A1
MLAKAVASECSCTFLNVSASTLGSKWRGESEKLVRILFEIAAYYSPSTIFIDEIDSIAGSRGSANEHESSRRVKTELMVQMDGMNSGLETSRRVSDPSSGCAATATVPASGSSSLSSPVIIVIAATNTPWDLDEALRRRFEKRIYIPLPDQQGRADLFRLNMRSLEVSSDIDYTELGHLSVGYTGADISNICRDASMMGIRRFLDQAKENGFTNSEIQMILKTNTSTFQENASVSLEIAPERGRERDQRGERRNVISLQSVVTREDFLLSLRKVNKSINGNDLKKFEDWMSQYGSS